MILALFHSRLSQIYFFKSVVLWNKWKKENATTLQSKNIWRKKIVKVNIKLSKLRQRPPESGYAESAFLIFGSLSNDDGGGCENVTYSITFNLSNVGGSTRIRYAIYISSLLASRHAQNEPVIMWFRGIFECCCYFECHDQACLYVAPPGRHFFALDEPKSSLTRFRVKTFYTPLSRPKRFHNLDAD